MERKKLAARARLLLGCVAAGGLLLAVACRRETQYFGKIDPPHENVFRFNNAAEPEYVDPGLLSGQPDDRIARLLFEGLSFTDPATMQPTPAAAERWDISPDHLTYTFKIRANAAWSDGRPLTAQDFVYSWTRVLEPATAAPYANHLYDIVNAQDFNEGKLKDASQLGFRALDDHTLEVRLREPTPYFLYLTAHATLYPVPREAVEKYGVHWTELGHIVNNGVFLLAAHRVNAQFEFVKNPRYWNAAYVRLDRVIAYSVDDYYTSSNMYEAGMLDWIPSDYVPVEFAPYMRAHFKDFHSTPFYATYYYLLNVTRPPLNNVLVRRALSMAIDRRAITGELLRSGQIPRAGFVPVGFPAYQSPPGPEFNPEQARKLLAQAGYPDGRGFPHLELLFNTAENHHQIAQAVQQMLAKNLNIEVALRNEEWGSYIKSRQSLDYDIARAGWIADVPDPIDFLNLMRGFDGNNNTGWKDTDYDRLMAAAHQEADPQKRTALLEQCEAILLREMPVLPVYTYSTNELVKPYVRGFYPSSLDEHPLNYVWIDPQWDRRSPRAGETTGPEGNLGPERNLGEMR